MNFVWNLRNIFPEVPFVESFVFRSRGAIILFAIAHPPAAEGIAEMFINEKEKMILQIFNRTLGTASVRLPIALGVLGDEQMRSAEVGYNIALLSSILFDNLGIGRVGVLDLQHRNPNRVAQTISQTLAKNSDAGRESGELKKNRVSMVDHPERYLWRDGTTELRYFLNHGNKDFETAFLESSSKLLELRNSLLLYQVDLLVVLCPASIPDGQSAGTLRSYDGLFNAMVHVQREANADVSMLGLAQQEIAEDGMLDSLRERTLFVAYNTPVDQNLAPLLSSNPPRRLDNRVVDDRKNKIFELRGDGKIFPVILDAEIIVPGYDRTIAEVCGSVFEIARSHELDIL
jgi:hypothetical protein